MFLQKEDLYKTIREYDLNDITGGDDTLVQHAMQSAVSEMTTYLQKRYDTNAIFSATGDDRNPLVLTFAIDIAVYEIVAITLVNQSLEDRRARYKRAIDYLKQVRDGELSPELPEKQTSEEYTNEAFGSNPKRNNYF